MNNREKRKMEKELGLLKVKKSMSLKEWSDEVGRNIEYGKSKHESMVELRRLQEQEFQDKMSALQISYIVEDLTSKGMNLIEAQEKAKELYRKQLQK